MNSRSLTLLLAIALVLFFGSSFVYTVKEYERGVMLKFGEIIDADLEPGLGFKLPIIHEPRLFDGRILTLDMRPEEYLTQEKKRLVVDSFLMWRIDNIEKFFTATGGGLEVQAQRLLAPRVNEGLRNKFGERSVYEVVSGEREELMQELTKEINKKTREEFGIEVVDVRVKRIELPASVSGSVYQRMRAEREREAREHRSRGKEKAEGIKAEADRERVEILAKAYKEAEQTRGEGDAESAAIYANAYNKDREFYEFFRKLQAYRQVFSSKQDIMVVKPDGEFFNRLKSEK
ncbi:MAG: protease modulator HflC [Ketobacteraceae bacterium]|nr:protease modulator HflC [Ketobacteraceae bacterium]